jgi:DNA polymerase-3 subunit beta
MKFSIDRLDFLKVLQRVQGIVEKRTTMPILSNVLLDAKKAAVNVLATDLEVFIKDSVKAAVAEDGATTVNARKLYEIVKEASGDTVEVTANKDDKVTIKAGKARFNVMGIASRDFPAFPAMDETTLKGIKGNTLREMIDKTSFAVSTDETRYNINGFLLEGEPGLLRLVSTDGHRLALIQKPDGGVETAKGKGVLLPRKGVMEIRRLLDEKDDGEILVGFSEKNAVVKKDATAVSIRLLEGEFPDYKKVIPPDNDKEVVAERAGLLSSLKRVSLLSPDKIKGVKFSFSPSKLTVSSSSPDIGEATEEMDIHYNGADIDVAFNARYLMDMLEVLSDERVKIELKDNLSPGIVRPEKDADYTYIIMPMRL